MSFTEDCLNIPEACMRIFSGTDDFYAAVQWVPE